MNMATLRKNKKTQAPADAGAELIVMPHSDSEATPSNDNSEEISVKPPNLVVIENFLKANYSFRYNLVSNRIEFKPTKTADYVLISDFHINSIYRKMKLNRIQISLMEIRSIINSDFVIKYDPFISYFDSLPSWDQKTDYIEQYASLVKTTNDILFQKCFKKWLVALVACAYDPAVVNHTVLIFSSKQGVGKTTFLMNLIPNELKQYVYSGCLNPDNKDSTIHLSECLLLNLDEIDNLNRGEISRLKEIITRGSIKIRKPFGHHADNLIRRASFCGSVNNKEFLNDNSGNRRFNCHDVVFIDYKKNVDLELVYTQAFHLFKNKFKFWFEGEDIDQITAHNEQFQSVTFEEELLLKYYERVDSSDTNLFLSATDIAAVFTENVKVNITNSFKQNLGKALAKHKFVRVKKNGRYVYALKNKSIPLSTSISLAGVQEN